ncbi:MAG: hypothetical protein WBG90_09460 [Saonia sp.]
MKKIIDNIANWLVGLTERKSRTDNKLTAFLNKGRNGLIVGAVIFGLLCTFLSFDLYRSSGKLWLALIPMVFFVFAIFGILVLDSYKVKIKKRNRGSRMKLVGFNLDFTERILQKIYDSLTKYEFLDENLTRFEHFYNVLVLDFEEHESVLHFNCTQPQLKYILDKFKQLKKGISLKSFERSKKIYHKGNLITAETLSKKYNESPPNQKFKQLIDSFFNFLGDI